MLAAKDLSAKGGKSLRWENTDHLPAQGAIHAGKEDY